MQAEQSLFHEQWNTEAQLIKSRLSCYICDLARWCHRRFSQVGTLQRPLPTTALGWVGSFTWLCSDESVSQPRQLPKMASTKELAKISLRRDWLWLPCLPRTLILQGGAAAPVPITFTHWCSWEPLALLDLRARRICFWTPFFLCWKHVKY